MASARLTKKTGAKSGSADGNSGIGPVNHSGLRSPADDEKVTASTSGGAKMKMRCCGGGNISQQLLISILLIIKTMQTSEHMVMKMIQ